MKLKKLFVILMITVLMSTMFTINVNAITNPIINGREIIGYENGDFIVKSIKAQRYTGSEITPDVEVYDYNTGVKLKEGIDYEVDFDYNIYPNGYYAPKAVIKGIGRYSDAESLTTYFAIVPKDISNNNAELTVITPCFEYDGQEKKPEIELVCDDVRLVENIDYELIFVNDNINVGRVYIMVSGIGNYSGTQYGSFEIDYKPILEEDISIDLSDRIYTGEDILPEVTIKSGEKTLVRGVDYQVDYPYTMYPNFTGEAWIEIWGLGNYKGNFTKRFNILGKDITKISNINIDTSDKKFINNFVEPLVELKDGNYTLIKNKDYEVSYLNNVIVGKATIKVTGRGIYRGEITKTFNIVENNINNISNVEIDTSDKIYNGNAIKPNVKLKNGDNTLVINKDYEVIYSNNCNPGTATIKIIGLGAYTGEIVKTFNIIQKNITKISTINVNTANKKYTGNKITTSVVLKDGNYTLVNGKDYTVSYSNNKNYGTATITITGKGGYAGKITKTFKIVPKTISITSLKNKFLRIVTIKWNKDTSVSGYEIYRSTSQNGSYSLVKTVTRNSNNSVTFVAQKKGTYYYKVRSYVTVNGTKIYGDFSTIQKVIVSR